MRILILGLCLLTFASCSSFNKSIERAVASSDQSKPNIEQVFEAASGDFNGDGYSDVALIVSNPANVEFFELWVYLSDESGHGSRNLAFVNKNFIHKVEGGFVSIGEPTLRKQEFNDSRPDTLVVESEHFGVGRFGSRYEVKFAFRDEKFVVAGLEYVSVDRVGEEGTQSCSYNTLNGRYSNGINRGLIRLEGKYVGVEASNLDGNYFNELVEKCPSQPR